MQSPPSASFTSPITPPQQLVQHDGGGGGGGAVVSYTGDMLNPLMSLLQSMTKTMTPELALAFGTAHVVQSMDRRVQSMDRRLDVLAVEAQRGFQEVGSHLTRIETNLNSLAQDAQSSLADVNDKLESLARSQAKKDFEEDPLVVFLSNKNNDNAACLRALLVLAKWPEFREQQRLNHLVLDDQHPLPYGPIYCNLGDGNSLLCIQTLCEAMEIVTGMSVKSLYFTQDLILGGGRRSGLTDFAELIGVTMTSVDRRTASLAFAGKMAKFVMLRTVDFERAIETARQLGRDHPLPSPQAGSARIGGLLPRVNWIRQPQKDEKFKSGKAGSESLSYPQYLFHPWLDARTTQDDVDAWCQLVDEQQSQATTQVSSYYGKVDQLFADKWVRVSSTARQQRNEVTVSRVVKARAAVKVEQTPRKRKADAKQPSPKRRRSSNIVIEEDEDEEVEEEEEEVVASGKVEPPQTMMETFAELEKLLGGGGGGGGGGGVSDVGFFAGHHDDLFGEGLFY
jgi:hypothetical protein